MTTHINALIPSSRSRAFNLDAIGFSASTLCAIHCTLTPLLLTALPLVRLRFLAHPAIEAAMIVVSLIIGATALAHGYFRHHHRLHALLLLTAGFAVILAGHLALPENFEAWATPTGALTIALSHLMNWRLCRLCQPCHPE
ncbi:MAG: MerC domain-containing protein [candidate division KSB1 bacterium]|nr:MerC domain-containing protein [candidate division KSB1 bacterium]MDZ7364826.1 MerC domain-containing protein [candidate division KSB1 bacterium]MDZ7402929.1 MerC domain-containing protein [candidate division KSB1 bacterium]